MYYIALSSKEIITPSTPRKQQPQENQNVIEFMMHNIEFMSKAIVHQGIQIQLSMLAHIEKVFYLYFYNRLNQQ